MKDALILCIHILCSSRKNPYVPTPWKVIENSEGEGGLKSQNVRSLTGVSWGYGRCKTKNLLWVEGGYFLELHNYSLFL